MVVRTKSQYKRPTLSIEISTFVSLNGHVAHVCVEINASQGEEPPQLELHETAERVVLLLTAKVGHPRGFEERELSGFQQRKLLL